MDIFDWPIVLLFVLIPAFTIFIPLAFLWAVLFVGTGSGLGQLKGKKCPKFRD